MDGLREPAGNLPPEVYLRRRIVAGLGFVLVLVVLYFLVSSPGGSKDDKGSPATGATTAASDAPTVSPGATAAPDVDAARACTAADGLLTVTPTPFKVTGGALPTFNVSIKQQGSSPCLLDTTADGTNFMVWSGGESNRDIYFDTAYCETDTTITSRQMVLQPGVEESLALTWNRNRVGEGCTLGSAAAPGFYWAKLTVQGIESEPAQFQIES
jgi:hypothetical protein